MDMMIPGQQEEDVRVKELLLSGNETDAWAGITFTGAGQED